jgi:hypothetical protein
MCWEKSSTPVPGVLPADVDRGPQAFVAVGGRHPDVDDGDVGPVLGDGGAQRVGVRDGGADLVPAPGLEQLARPLGVGHRSARGAEPLLGHVQAHRQRDQSDLRPVVEVPLQPAQQRRRVVHGQRPGLLQVAYPLGEVARPEQGAQQPAVHRDHPAGEPGGGEQRQRADAGGEEGAARERRDRPHDRAAGGADLLMDDRPAQRRDAIEPSDQPPGRRVQFEDRDRQLHQQVRGRAPARLVPQPSVQPGEELAGGARLRRRGEALPQQACGQGPVECRDGAGEAEGEDDQGKSQDGTDQRGGERDVQSPVRWSARATLRRVYRRDSGARNGRERPAG